MGAGGRPSKLPDILSNEKLIEELHAMAEEGHGLVSFYVKMGINKSTANEWKNPESDYYSPEFSNLIHDLYVKSQDWWERKGRDCLHDDTLNAALFNKQIMGRFKDDWSPHSTTDVTTKGQSIKPKDATSALLAKLPQETLEQIMEELESDSENNNG